MRENEIIKLPKNANRSHNGYLINFLSSTISLFWLTIFFFLCYSKKRANYYVFMRMEDTYEHNI